MGGITFGSWAALGSTNQTISAASSAVFGTVDNAGKIATEVSVQLTHNASAVKGASLQIERDIDGANFEGESSAPWTTPLPFAAGATRERAISVPADMIGKFRVRLVNLDTGQAITACTVRTRQATYA